MACCKKILIQATHTGQGEGVQWGEDSVCEKCRRYASCEMRRASYGDFYRGWEVTIVECNWLDEV